MLAQITKSFVKSCLMLSVIFLSACSSFKQYPLTEKPNFTLNVKSLYTGGAFNSLFNNSYVDLHIHIDPEKTSKRAQCVPGEDRWYKGSVTQLKENQSKAIHLPIGQRAYMVVKQITTSWSGDHESVNVITFDLVPEAGKKYEFNYKQTEIVIDRHLSVWRNNKKQVLAINDWVDCF